MIAAAQKVTILVSEFRIEGYQLTGSGKPLLGQLSPRPAYVHELGEERF